MILLLNVSNRRKYCTIRVQINNQHKAEFDCLKNTPIDEVLLLASKAVTKAEHKSKVSLFYFANNPEKIKNRINELNKIDKNSKKTFAKIENLFTISNITYGGVSNDILNDYVVKINDKEVGSYKHNRDDGLSICLEKASRNINDHKSCLILTLHSSFKKSPKIKK